MLSDVNLSFKCHVLPLLPLGLSLIVAKLLLPDFLSLSFCFSLRSVCSICLSSSVVVLSINFRGSPRTICICPKRNIHLKRCMWKSFYFYCDLGRFRAIATMNADVSTELTLLGIKWAQLRSPVIHKSSKQECFLLGCAAFMWVRIALCLWFCIHTWKLFCGPNLTEIYQMFINWLCGDLRVWGGWRGTKKLPPQITDKALVDGINAADEIR